MGSALRERWPERVSLGRSASELENPEIRDPAGALEGPRRAVGRTEEHKNGDGKYLVNCDLCDDDAEEHKDDDDIVPVPLCRALIAFSLRLRWGSGER